MVIVVSKIKLVIAYDGTDFHGFAKQRGLRTVQGVLEDTLARIVKHPVEVFGSGRTDAGVHARGQVVHFEQTVGPPAQRYGYLLRRSLPKDMIAVRAEPADADFHARFSVRCKTYRYTVQTAAVPDIYTNRYVWHEPHELDVERMRLEAAHLIGEHDFTSFCAAATPIRDKRRSVYDVAITQDGSYLHIWCTGNGFLQYMVRIIVGTLIDMGEDRMHSRMPEIIAQKDRTCAGQTAPACGLTLWSVDYSVGSDTAPVDVDK